MTDRLARRTILAGLAASAAVGPASGAVPDRVARIAGQLLTVGFSGAEPDDHGTRQMLAHAAAGRIGGVLLLDRNIRSRRQVGRLTGAIAAATVPPVLVAVDQEGGAIQRLGPDAGFSMVPAARTLGQGLPAEARRDYRRMAQELSRAGVTMNLGPVVDLARDGGRGVIGRLWRAYSSSPEVVRQMAGIFAEAHRRAGVITVLKHFPGHGSAVLDSHRALPDIAATWREDELVPFRALIRGGAPAVMTGHLVHPRFSDGRLPASLSQTTTRFLRRKLGFGGVIVTDDLQMQAVRLAVGSDEAAAVQALKAGADLLIFSSHPRHDPTLVDRLHDAIARAVGSGELSLATLKAAQSRVNAMKRRWLAHR